MSKQKRVVRWARPDERVGGKNITSKPGYKVFIANRGEVRLDFPEPWVINFGDDSIRITDKEPPDDDCILQLSVHYLPPGIDWSGMPLKTLVESLDGKDDNPTERQTLGRGEIVEIKRGKLEIAWVEYRILDVKENREAISRLALARANDIQPLITFDFWPEDQKRLDPVWNEVLRSLQIGTIGGQQTLPTTQLPERQSLFSPYATTNSKFDSKSLTKPGAISDKTRSREVQKFNANHSLPPSKAKDQGVTLPLPDNHGWRSSPGYKIFVANKGEVRFDYPESWEIDVASPITFRNRPQPADTCRLRLFIYHPSAKQKQPAPIKETLEDLVEIVRAESDEDLGYSLGHGEINIIPREDLDLAWRQDRYFDPNRQREILTRSSAARAKGTIALLMFDFPSDERSTYDPIWDEILRSLQVGNLIDDPVRHFMN